MVHFLQLVSFMTMASEFLAQEPPGSTIDIATHGLWEFKYGEPASNALEPYRARIRYEDPCGSTDPNPASKADAIVHSRGDSAYACRSDNEGRLPARAWDRHHDEPTAVGWEFTQQDDTFATYVYIGTEPGYSGGIEGRSWTGKVLWRAFAYTIGSSTNSPRARATAEGWTEWWSTSSADTKQTGIVSGGAGVAISTEDTGSLEIGNSLIFGVSITLQITLSTTPAEGTIQGSVVEPHRCLNAWQYRISAGVHSSALADGSTQQVLGGCEAITAYAQSLVNVWSEADIDLNRIPLDQCNP